MTTKWGRIGQSGQSNTKSFPGGHKRDRFISSKTWEKQGKGYTMVTKEEFDLLNLQAEIMGSGNKVERTAIVLQDGNAFHEVPNQAAYDPTLELGIMISFRLRDKQGATEPYSLIFLDDKVYDFKVRARNPRGIWKKLNFRPVQTWTGDLSKVDDSHPLSDMVEKLQEVLGTTL